MKLSGFVGLPLIGGAAVIAVAAGVGWGQTVTPLTAPAPASAQPVQPPQPPYIAPLVSPAPIQSRCEAASLAWLVGKPRTAIPVPVDLSNRRVSCTTCPVTQDYVPERTDILFDAQTGLITAVKCG
jgi:hypothetical protein